MAYAVTMTTASERLHGLPILAQWSQTFQFLSAPLIVLPDPSPKTHSPLTSSANICCDLKRLSHRASSGLRSTRGPQLFSVPTAILIANGSLNRPQARFSTNTAIAVTIPALPNTARRSLISNRRASIKEARLGVLKVSSLKGQKGNGFFLSSGSRRRLEASYTPRWIFSQ